MDDGRRDGGGERAFAPLFAAAVAASVTEGMQAGVATARSGQGIAATAIAGWEGFGVVLFPAMAIGTAIALVATRPATRSIAKHASIALIASPKARSGGVALVALLATAGVVGARAGRASSEHTTANVAVTIAAAITVATIAIGALGIAFASRAIARWRRRKRAASMSSIAEPTRSAGVLRLLARAPSLVVPAAIAAGAFVALPVGQATTVATGVIAFALGSTEVVRSALADLLASGRGGIAVYALTAIGLAAIGSFSRIPAPVRLVVLYRAPVAGALIESARGLVDFDHDGYSAILGGGDCDDRDPSIHPGARDVPGNHVDEDCSGRDATPFVPAQQPPFTIPSDVPRRPNVILVQMDALRPDHLGFAGYERPTSPKMDAFRASATWFDHAYTPAPTTRFAMAMLFTGQEVDHIPQKRGRGVDFDMLYGPETIASRLARVGYDRVGLTITYVIQHIRGVGAGFRLWQTPWPIDDWKSEYPVTATHTTDKAIEYLGSMPDDGSKPYFLFLHYRCTHDPYASNPRWSYGPSLVDEYDSAVSYCDDEIGRLVSAIDARGDRDRTAVIFFSDHGELFGEHGLTHHGSSVFQPDVRILLLARVPWLAGVPVVHEPVSMVDVEPTILAIAGAPADARTLGWNLLPLIANGDAAGRPDRPIYFYEDLTRGTVHHESRGVLVGDEKYVRDLTADATALYDVARDPDEAVDLRDARPGDAEKLRERLESWEAFAAGE